ncbi:MAG: hypothetical protein KF846_08580 [Cyclobacteriaceae bacterium]|nr:hypothetical protein [Cyclobacteriaceae bacterium]
MDTPEKLSKLTEKMQQLVNRLHARQDLILHERVSQFFYMQKIEELKILADQFDTLKTNLDNLTQHLHEHYSLCFSQWCRDVRWVNLYIHRERHRSIL